MWHPNPLGKTHRFNRNYHLEVFVHICAVEVPTLHSKMSVATMSDVESAETVEQPDDELFILPGISHALCFVYN